MNRRRFLTAFAAALPIPAAAEVVTITTSERIGGKGSGSYLKPIVELKYEIEPLAGFASVGALGWAVGPFVGERFSITGGGSGRTSKAQHSADEFDDLYVPAAHL